MPSATTWSGGAIGSSQPWKATTFALIFSVGQFGRIEQAVERDRGGDVGAGAREVERALPAEAIAGDDHLPSSTSRQPAHLLDDRQQPPPERDAVVAEPVHLAEHHVARAAAELLAENVGDEAVVAELDQLLREAELEVGDAHHGRDQHDRRPRLRVAAADEDAFQLLAFELERNRRLLAHSISFAIAASFATRVHVARRSVGQRRDAAASTCPCRSDKCT